MQIKKEKICVIGLGYIGLPTAALLATEGYEVFGVDINPDVVSNLKKGKIHIVEPGLDNLVKSAISSGKLQVSLEPESADIYIICVPTPVHQNEEIPTPNIDYVFAAAKTLAPLLKSGDMLIVESTCPVGTVDAIRGLLDEIRKKTNDINIAYCPERVLPGNIINELKQNDRIVGGINDISTKKASDFYKNFVIGDVLQTSAKVAEICKLTENSFRDVNIAFANELSIICDTHGIDVWELINLANRHPRVNILQPGVGVGGHCIAVDPWFIVSGDPKNSNIIRTARNVNNSKPEWVVNKIIDAVNERIAKGTKKPKVACLGLAFKPNIDDLRGSPAVEIAIRLLSLGINVIAVEPNIKKHNKINLLSFEEALDYADILVVLVKHKEFVSKLAKERLYNAQTLDFCGALD